LGEAGEYISGLLLFTGTLTDNSKALKQYRIQKRILAARLGAKLD
jgi:hypothetical protein